MLIACTACHRQYDVGDLPAGARVRCHCGEVSSVPEPRPRQVRMLHCSNCGGVLPGEGEACAYCDAVPSPSESLAGGPCPRCFAQLAGDAPYCPGCGVRIDPQAVLQALSDRACPACEDVNLVAVEPRDDAPFYQCTDCQGIWLAQETFRRVAQESAERAPPAPLPDELRRSAAPRQSVGRSRKKERWRRCPVCSLFMKNEEFARISRVRLDRCPEHGTWFDADELAEVKRFIEDGGLADARARRDARREQVVRAAWKGHARRAREALKADRQNGLIAFLQLFED